ncbi:MAG TPA: hypothetical protein PKY82_09535 [Pyrinomonadaceae bacterium]|nr:hypothetical protein [Pyrinomonadaceae bacterium]
MSKFFRIAILAFLLVSFVPSAIAQKQKSKDDYLKEISALFKTKKPEDLEKAYFLGKEYLVKFGNEKDENTNKVKDFVKKNRENQFFIYLEQQKFSEAFSEGKEILDENPENVFVSMNLAFGGYNALATKNDKSFTDQSINYAKQTISLLEKGTTPSSFSPASSKDDAISWMYYIIGNFTKDTNYKESVANFYKSTQFEGKIKSTSMPYFAIAVYFEDVYEKIANEYNSKNKTMTEAQRTTELEKVNKVMDQMMDAYARAIKFGEAENNPQKDEWKKRLTEVYKFRKKTDAGLNEYITLVNTKPLADPMTF